MCGIFGTTDVIDQDCLTTVLQLLQHRGPDSNGFERIRVNAEKQLTFVHTRLAIQDLSPNGHQPMTSRDGRWTVTFNGEIYNHTELRQGLNGPFNGTSDTESLVEHLAAHGLGKTLPRLNGIFAFAAYDRQQQRLHLVRDPFGIKPLYYRVHDGQLTFASEIKPLSTATGYRPGLDNAALDTFLTLRYTPSPATLLQGIQRLAPGHYLDWNMATGAYATEIYIEPTRQQFQGSPDDAVEAYLAEIRSAVKRQLLSDVPVGVLLSGGIDSALITALAKECSDDLTSYTVGFGDIHEECEIEDAGETARVLGMTHRFVRPGTDDLLNSLDNIVLSVEEPLGTTSIMPMWYLVQRARQDVTVVLTGQGSDEPLGGYRRYQAELLFNKLPALKQNWTRPLAQLGQLTYKEAFRRGLGCIGRSEAAQRFTRAYTLFSDNEKTLLTGRSLDAATPTVASWLHWLDGCEHVCDTEKMMRIDTRMNLADDLLLYGDKISMAYALEARVPMLDIELVKFIESLPLGYRTSLRRTKIVHKDLANRYLPETIVNRPKKGFQVPFGTWSRSIWKDYIQDRLLDKNRKLYHHLDHAGVQRIWQRHLAGKPDYSKQIFMLLTLSIWCEHFL